MAEEALGLELGCNLPIVWLGPDDGGGVIGVDVEKGVRGAIRDLLDLDRRGAGEDRGRSAWRQVGRLALFRERLAPARARVGGWHSGYQGLVVRAIPRLVLVELVVERLLLDERQDVDPPAQERLAILVRAVGGGEGVIYGVVVMHGQADLLEIVHALGAVGRLARLGNRHGHQFGRLLQVCLEGDAVTPRLGLHLTYGRRKRCQLWIVTALLYQETEGVLRCLLKGLCRIRVLRLHDGAKHWLWLDLDRERDPAQALGDRGDRHAAELRGQGWHGFLDR